MAEIIPGPDSVHENVITAKSRHLTAEDPLLAGLTGLIHVRIEAERVARSTDRRAAFSQEFAKNRSVTPRFVLAVAADREVRLMRESREQIEGSPRRRFVHLRTEGPQKSLPLPLGRGQPASR